MSAVPTKVSEILSRIANSQEITQDAREAIQSALRPHVPPKIPKHHPDCPCIRCHRYYGTLR